jgi:hypothetical protein
LGPADSPLEEEGTKICRAPRTLHPAECVVCALPDARGVQPKVELKTAPTSVSGFGRSVRRRRIDRHRKQRTAQRGTEVRRSVRQRSRSRAARRKQDRLPRPRERAAVFGFRTTPRRPLRPLADLGGTALPPLTALPVYAGPPDCGGPSTREDGWALISLDHDKLIDRPALCEHRAELEGAACGLALDPLTPFGSGLVRAQLESCTMLCTTRHSQKCPRR